MSNPRVLICGPALDARESANTLEMLRPISLPNATKFVITTGKFETVEGVRPFNVEANYPPEPPYLQTLATLAEMPVFPEPQFRDAYDLFCLRALLAKHPLFDVAVLLRDGSNFESCWPELLDSLAGKLFLPFELRPADNSESPNTNLVIDLRDKRASTFLDQVGRFYASGAAYAIEAYTLEWALHLAMEGLRFQQLITERIRSAAQPRSAPYPKLSRKRASREFGASFIGRAALAR